MHGIPLRNRSAKMGELLGKRIGRVIRIDKVDKENRIREEFIRVRVAIDIGKLLVKGIHVMLGVEKT